MAINWYPGHMHKALKEIRNQLKEIDIAIHVVDARLPYSSLNPKLAELMAEKPTIKVLTKCDLADPIKTQQWQQYFEQDNKVKTLAFSKNEQSQLPVLISLCRQLIPLKKQGIPTIQAMIMGIPNVGKSTLINQLAGRHIAKTGNEPAVTKIQQRIKLDRGLVLLDTPGLLWPKLENQHSAYRLAITGAIKETAISNEDIALYAVGFLRSTYPQALTARYRLDELSQDDETLLADIGLKRGCLASKGRIDLARAAKILLTELRAGTLGKITLETPETMVTEQIELAENRKISQQKQRDKRSGKQSLKAK